MATQKKRQAVSTTAVLARILRSADRIVAEAKELERDRKLLLEIAESKACHQEAVPC